MMRPSKNCLVLLLTLLGFAGVRAQLPGTLDTNFSVVISSYPIIHSVILQSDGKVLVGGLFDTVNGAKPRSPRASRLHWLVLSWARPPCR